MKILPRAVLILLSVLTASGCTVLQPLFGPKKSEIPEATLPAWIGRVVMVDATHRFVLVDTGASAAPTAGTEVFTLRDKRKTSVLRVTGEARPPYVAMEILDGEPELGDQAAIDESGKTPALSPPSE